MHMHMYMYNDKNLLGNFFVKFHFCGEVDRTCKTSQGLHSKPKYALSIRKKIDYVIKY